MGAYARHAIDGRLVIGVVAIATALAACKPTPEDKARAEESKVDAEVRTYVLEAREVVRRALRDPESARFRKGAVADVDVKAGKLRVACGFVNAKNGFGGYTGEGYWWMFEFTWDGSRGVCIDDLDKCAYAKGGGLDGAINCREGLRG